MRTYSRFHLVEHFFCRPDIRLFFSSRSTGWIAIAMPIYGTRMFRHIERGALQCPALQQEERKRRRARFEIAPDAALLL
jgi:hypothetical protein